MDGLKHSIVCISTIDWDFIWQGHQEIMATFAQQGHRVLFIENTGVRNVQLKDLSRLKNRLLNWRKGVRGIREVTDNLYVYSPLVLPFPYSRIARVVNRLIMVRTLQSWARTMQFENPIIWTWLPTALAMDLIMALNGKLTVYYCFDNFEAIGPSTKRIRRTEQKLINKADLVFATSRNLYDYCSQFNPHVYLFPSGFSKSHFHSGARIAPDDLAKIRRPIVGYVGGIHKIVDFELLAKIVRFHQDKSFVFVGPLQTDVGSLAECTNVHFLGQRRHDELPNYIASFDVCLIPYVLNEYSRNVYPTKLNEYLSMGKPVVSTKLPEIVHFNEGHAGVVSIAERHEDFAELIDSALVNDTDSLRSLRMKVTENNSWEAKIEAMEGLIKAKLEENSKSRDLNWQSMLSGAFRSSRRRVAAFLATCALFYGLLFYSPLLWWLAEPLRVVNEPIQADVIVVLAGGIGESGEAGEEYQEKVKRAVELYRHGYAAKLIFSSGEQYVFREAQVMKALALALGVPDSAILLDETGGGNYSSFLNVKRIMMVHGWRRFLLVASHYNGARSRLVVRENCPECRLAITPAERSAFFGSHDRVELKHLRAIIHEYAAIIYYWSQGYI